MEWFETENVRFIGATAEKFAARELSAFGALQRENGAWKDEWTHLLQAGRELGFFACALPESLGGIGLDASAQVMMILRLAEQSAAYGARVAIHVAATEVFARAPEAAPPEALERLFALALPDPITERADQSGWLVVPSPEEADEVLLVDPVQGPVRIASDRFGDEAFSGRPTKWLDELGRLRFVADIASLGGQKVPVQNPADTAGAVRARLHLLVAAARFGNARAAQKAAVQYACDRIQTGRPIIDHQQVRQVLVRSEMHLLALESHLFRMAAFPAGQGSLPLDPYDLLFMYAGSATERVCLDAIQTLGGYGYMKDYGLEKRLRDDKALAGLTGSCLADQLGCAQGE